MSDLYVRFLEDEKSLNLKELKDLKNEFENGLSPEYAERNIKKIDRIIKQNQRSEEYIKDQEQRWYRKAVKGKEIKEVWETHGAYFKSNGYSTTWYLGGIPFYKWYSRANVDEEYPKLLNANEKFNELLRSV